jgi:hypothetical protein
MITRALGQTGRTLDDRTITDVNHQFWATQMVTQDAVCFAIFKHVIRHVGFGAVNKLRDHIAITIQLSDRIEAGVLNLTWFCQLFFTLFLFFDVQKKSDFWQKSDFSVL